MFHDGTPLDAAALHLNIENTASGVLTGPAFADFSSATVTGPLSVTINLKAPWAPFPYYLAQAQTGYIAAPSMLNSADGGTSNPIGTGPFVFQDWVPNSHMTATRNPHYWRKGYPYLNSITYKPIINDDSRADALETGEIDIMHSNSPDNLLQFRGNKKYAYYDNSGQIVGQPTVQCIMLNTSKAPFNNKTLRQAMAMCINQAQFSKVIDKGIDAPMNGLFLPGSEYYTKTAYPKYNPTQAAKLVKQVQQQTGSQPAFTLNSTSDPETLAAAQFLQQAWQTAGMKVTITILAQATIINDALAGTYEATLWRQFGAVDPDLNYVWWSTTTVNPPLPLNMARNNDPRIQTALTAGRETNEKADRIKAYQQINQYLAQDIPYLWLARDTWCRRGQPEGAELRQPDHAAGLEGRRLRRGRALAGTDLDEELAYASAHLHVVEVLLAPVGEALLGQAQAVGRPERLHEAALVADGDDGAGPGARAWRRRRRWTRGRGCWSARRAGGGWPPPPTAWPARAWPAPLPRGCPAAGRPPSTAARTSPAGRAGPARP